MRNFDSSLFTSDRAQLHTSFWEPDDDAKAVICLVHGWGEHCGRYEHVANFFIKQGFDFYSFDLRGHGQSSGRRGDTPSYERLLLDIADIETKLHERYPDKALFLYGHSLGGNLALNYALTQAHRFTGIISTSPWLRLSKEPPAIIKFIGRLMNKLAPWFTLSQDLDSRKLAQNATIGQQYDNDPLNHNKISARLYQGITESGNWALDHADELKTPTLLFHGEADEITSYQASHDFARRAKQVEFKLWPNCFHELHNEPNQNEILNDIQSWITNKLSSNQTILS
jgi:alpha-beta hydrolase superfamily lysophospholipase